MILEGPFKELYTVRMKIINNTPTSLTFVQFESEDEQIFISEMVNDLGFTNVIVTEDGFFCLTTEVFEIMEIFKESAAEMVD